ncbi:hypothetical protein ACFLTB_07650 [Chloroflexota bacterium]
MPLNDEQKEKLADWLHSKECSPDCPSCGHNEWSFGDIVAVPHFAGGVVDDTTFVPVVQLVCKNCAFVRSHAAIPIGLLDVKKEETKGPAEQEDE